MFSCLLVFLMVIVLSACGNGGSLSTTQENGSVEESESASEVTLHNSSPKADGYDILGGQLWEIGGIYYNNRLIDIHDDPTLELLYSCRSLNFDENGTFQHVFLYYLSEGSYQRFGSDRYRFLLKEEKNLVLDSNSDTYVENESEPKHTYLITVIDENTIEYVEFDPIMSKAKANEKVRVYVKTNKKSPYILENKIDLTPKENSDNHFDFDSIFTKNENEPSNSSYQEILDNYTLHMEQAVSNLVREYKAESSGISDVEQLAIICNNKIEALATICMEGVEKMAELMYSKDDSYETYEEWAGKLQDNYIEIASEIQNAYLYSAVN